MTDSGRALEDGAHSLRKSIGIAVGLLGACDLLELVEEHNDLLAVRLSDPARQRERIVEVALRVARCQPRPKRNLELLAKLSLGLHDRRRLHHVGHESASPPRLMNDATQSRSVFHGLRDQGFRQLRRRRDPEEIDGDRVEPAAAEATEDGVTNTRLAGPTRAGDHDARASREYRRDLSHVRLPADHLTGRERLIRRKEVGAALPAHVTVKYMRQR